MPPHLSELNEAVRTRIQIRRLEIKDQILFGSARRNIHPPKIRIIVHAKRNILHTNLKICLCFEAALGHSGSPKAGASEVKADVQALGEKRLNCNFRNRSLSASTPIHRSAHSVRRRSAFFLCLHRRSAWLRSYWCQRSGRQIWAWW